MNEDNQELRATIAELMPVDRCYGSNDVWCEDCKAAIDKILTEVESEKVKARIDELREVQEYYVADYVDTTAGKNIDNYIESRLTELQSNQREES